MKDKNYLLKLIGASSWETEYDDEEYITKRDGTRVRVRE